MSARQKLNHAAVNGALIVASVFGIVTQSAAVFFVALMLILAANFFAGTIRISPRQRIRRR